MCIRDRLRTFTMSDYADVVTRGFIEGYYGNPWSTEDRVNLMQWGGYYKLNAYVYAPKDDPKHNAKWRELYTEEELTEKIEPLAAVSYTHLDVYKRQHGRCLPCAAVPPVYPRDHQCRRFGRAH